MPTWVFSKRAGAPAGQIAVNVVDGSFIINDTTNPTISTANPQVAGELSSVNYLSLSSTLLNPVQTQYAPSETYVRNFGSMGNDSNDDSVGINAALATVSALGGGKVVVPPGIYRAYNPIIAQNNTQLELQKGAIIMKYFTGGAAVALIQQSSYTSATSLLNFHLTGKGKLMCPNFATAGSMVYLYGTNLELVDFTIDTWGGDDGTNNGGRAIDILGNGVRINNVKAFNPYPSTGVGGIRIQGGTNIIVTNCHMETGDDTYQFVPVGNPAAAQFDKSITKSAYIGCTGYSRFARFLIAALINQAGDTGMTASILDCKFSNCHGYSTTRRMYVTNSSSSGTIRNVTFDNCTADCVNYQGAVTNVGGISAGASAVTVNEAERYLQFALTTPFTVALGGAGATETLTVQSRTLVSGTTYTYGLSGTTAFAHAQNSGVVNAEAALQGVTTGACEVDGRLGAAANGSIENITYSKCRVIRPLYSSVNVPQPVSPEVSNIQTLNVDVDCDIGVLDPSSAQIGINGVTNAEVRGSLAPQTIAGSDIILFGRGATVQALVTDARVVGARFKGLSGTDTFGVNFNQVNGGNVTECSFNAAGAVGTPRAVHGGTGSTGLAATRNDVSSFGAISPWTVASGVAIIARDNIGDANPTLTSLSPMWTPADHGLISWAFDPAVVSGLSTPLATAGLMYVVKLHVASAASITNILGFVLTAGATLTAGQCFAVLYQGGTKIGQTADQAASWVSTGLKTMALSGGPFSVSTGDVYVGVYFNGTTGPAFTRAGTTASSTATINAGLPGVSPRFGSANSALTTTPPTTLGTLSSTLAPYWFALS